MIKLTETKNPFYATGHSNFTNTSTSAMHYKPDTTTKGKSNQRVPLYPTMADKITPSVLPLLCFGIFNRFDKDVKRSKG